MKRQIRETADGSKTIFIADLNEHYHSINGALTESRHVFIKAGFNFIKKDKISILEIGFGTGLNALTTLEQNIFSKKRVSYTGVEAYPVKRDEMTKLNYNTLNLNQDIKLLVDDIHNTEWGIPQEITPLFYLEKVKSKFQDLAFNGIYDLIYFDAFAPSAQPELWTIDIFNSMFSALKPEGILVTYCAKGQVKRNMKAAGFTIEGLPGPPGKREMTRATKPLVK